MSEKGMENNKVSVIGTIVSDFTFSHAVFGEGFYLLDLSARVCHFIQYIIIKFFLILQGFPCFFNTHMI